MPCECKWTTFLDLLCESYARKSGLNSSYHRVRHTNQIRPIRPTAGNKDSNATIEETVGTSPSGILLLINKGINSRAETQKVVPINMAIFVSLRGQLREDRLPTRIAKGIKARIG
jgi:hypothetical protein